VTANLSESRSPATGEAPTASAGPAGRLGSGHLLGRRPLPRQRPRWGQHRRVGRRADRRRDRRHPLPHPPPRPRRRSGRPGAPTVLQREVLTADTDDQDLDPAAAALSKSRQRVLTALRAGGDLQTVKQLGDRLAQAGHPLKPRTIQTALGELEAAGLAAGSEEGDDRARYWSPASANRTLTMPATVKRAMVGERAWHDRPGNVLDRGLAEPAHGASHGALVRLVVTDLRTAQGKNVLTNPTQHYEHQAASL
jgi:hypothetical protein